MKIVKLKDKNTDMDIEDMFYGFEFFKCFKNV